MQVRFNKSRESITTSSSDSFSEPLKKFQPIRSVVWMILIGDAIHNFVDGVAIGVAFSEGFPKGLRGGISTSIAILCHELPHELGNLICSAYLMMSFRKQMCERSETYSDYFKFSIKLIIHCNKCIQLYMHNTSGHRKIWYNYKCS